MNLFELVGQQTSELRSRLLGQPVISDCLAGRVSVDTYAAFLAEAYHHVRHTVPLLMACGSRLPNRLEWLRAAVIDYVDEEYGHERWILGDLEALGRDAKTLAASEPGPATELMVAYAYDTVQRRNPVGFFGMAYVLEGTSVAIATRAAHVLKRELGLPERALRYLLSHGAVDIGHVERLGTLLNRLDVPADRLAVLHAARIFYRLYGAVFESLPRAVAQGSIQSCGAAGAETREVA